MTVYSVDKLWEDFELWYVFRNSRLVAKFSSKKLAEEFLAVLKKEAD